MTNETVHSERPQHSPSERAARVRRCARALKQGGVEIRDLRRLYTEGEVEEAKQMVENAA